MIVILEEVGIAIPKYVAIFKVFANDLNTNQIEISKCQKW